MIDYYRVRDFKKINEIAPKQDGKVACLGLIPEIAQFNGYHTVGGYYSIAPRSSTKHIESIVREELLSLNQKSLERKFFLPSIQYLDEKVKVITDLQWDWNQLKDHDVKYVFSLKPIEIDELDFLSQVSEIYVYHLN
jgi:hypothetical protein